MVTYPNDSLFVMICPRCGWRGGVNEVGLPTCIMSSCQCINSSGAAQRLNIISFKRAGLEAVNARIRQLAGVDAITIDEAEVNKALVALQQGNSS